MRESKAELTDRLRREGRTMAQPTDLLNCRPTVERAINGKVFPVCHDVISNGKSSHIVARTRM